MSDGGVLEEICGSDAVSPAQFHEMWSGTADRRSGAFMLALAVLEQALEDLEQHRFATDSGPQRVYRQAETWVQSNDRRWPYSFVNICEMLNVPMDRLRVLVLSEWVTPVAMAMREDDDALPDQGARSGMARA